MQGNQTTRHSAYHLFSDGSAEAAELVDRVVRAAGEPADHLTDAVTLSAVACGDAEQVVFVVPPAGESVLSAMRALSALDDSPPILAVGSSADVRLAIHALQSGAGAYYTTNEIDVLSDDLVCGRHVRRDDTAFARRESAFSAIVTRDSRMRSLIVHARGIARSSVPVLITGEPGVGKELVARGIHSAGRRDGAFVVANAAGLDDTACAEALFGSASGSAGEQNVNPPNAPPGLVGRAAGGTLFLKEIADLGPTAQVKLLRLLEERVYYPVGSNEPCASDARVVAATGEDFLARVRAGSFRLDLFYRLAAFHLRVPPLRSRRADVLPLAERFAGQIATDLGVSQPTFAPALLTQLERYDYPGNVRELRSIVSTLIESARDLRVRPDALEALAHSVMRRNASVGVAEYPAVTFSDTLPTMEEVAEQLIDEALRRTDGNQSAAARMLGLSPSAISKRLHRRSVAGRT